EQSRYTQPLMLISIVIPAYNEEQLIGSCLRSVLKETCRYGGDAEVLVINNASTDRTRDVAGRYPGVRVIDEPRKGLSRARHRGYLESCGDLVVNVDADCVMPRGYLDRVVRSFAADSRLTLLTGPFLYRDLPQVSQVVTIIFYLFQAVPNIIGQRILKIGAVAQGGNFTARRSALQKVGGYNTSLTFYGEDTDIAIRLSRVGLVRFSFSVIMKTSGRRLRKQGVLRAGTLYALNIIFMMVRGRPLTRTHQDVRLA
ncbi:MAG TPA: glycosyltransferase family A protein, partial [Spirochaetia bacterium]|nr:glycosyltransferase family A protein [Spirochaetia bacterium]